MRSLLLGMLAVLIAPGAGEESPRAQYEALVKEFDTEIGPAMAKLAPTVFEKDPTDAVAAQFLIGTAFEKQKYGDAIAILNLDNEPSEAALKEVQSHPDVTGVQLVKLPPAGDLAGKTLQVQMNLGVSYPAMKAGGDRKSVV